MYQSAKAGYKQTSVGVIPMDWKVKEVADFAAIKTGNRDTQDKIEDGEYPFFVRSQTIERINSYSFDGEAVLTSGDGVGVGKIYHYIQGKFDYHQRVYNIHSFKQEVLGQFFYFYFSQHFRKRVYRLSAKNSVDSVRFEMIGKMKIPLPPLPEQRKIAEILSTWDEAIAQTKALIEQLKLRNKGLAQQLLTGKKRLKGFSGEWKEVALEDITNRITRRNEELDDTVVTISAQRGFVRQEDFFKKRVASETLSNYYLIHRGEFAYNKSYSNGYPMGAFKRLNSSEKAVVTTLYICFGLKPGVNSDYIVHFFESGGMVKNLMRIAQEGGRAHGLLNIGIADFFGLKLLLPEQEEQRAISELLNSAQTELRMLEEKLSELEMQKKGLMQKLLTGEVRVKID